MNVDTGHWLCVEGIAVLCTIGVTERERRAKQRVVINVRFDVDFGAVSESDDIEDSVDYRLISRRVIDEASKSSFRLIETLAAHLCRTLLREFPRIQKIATEVWKPGALSAARTVGATVVSSRRCLDRD